MAGVGGWFVGWVGGWVGGCEGGWVGWAVGWVGWWVGGSERASMHYVLYAELCEAFENLSRLSLEYPGVRQNQ